MKSVNHPSNTRTLGAPAGWDQSGLPVDALGITDQVMEGVPCVLSFWEPDAVELDAIIAGGKVILSIVGRTMPPALLLVEQPAAMAHPAEPASPIAWAVFTPEGNIRIWTSVNADAAKIARRLEQPLTPLFSHAPTLSASVRRVLAERQRQVSVKGWTPEHDAREHDSGELAAAAAAYALAAADALHPQSQGDGDYSGTPPTSWPANWDWKPASAERMLEKAAALILAELERIDGERMKKAA